MSRTHGSNIFSSTDGDAHLTYAEASGPTALSNFYSAIDQIGEWLLQRGLVPLKLSVDLPPDYSGYVISLVLSCDDLLDLAPYGHEFLAFVDGVIPLRLEFLQWVASEDAGLAQVVNWRSDYTCVLPIYPDHQSARHRLPARSYWEHVVTEQETRELADIERLRERNLDHSVELHEDNSQRVVGTTL
jgi:hypothetical protein